MGFDSKYGAGNFTGRRALSITTSLVDVGCQAPMKLSRERRVETASGDVSEELVTLRNGLTSSTDDDSPITDFKGVNIPSHAIEITGHQRYMIRALGTGNADTAATLYIQLWPRSNLQLGRLAYKATITLGTATTDKHPVTGDGSTTRKHVDGFSSETASVAYEKHELTNGTGSCVIVDLEGAAYLSAQLTITSATTMTIIGQAL